mgnify:CR=1 FL=1
MPEAEKFHRLTLSSPLWQSFFDLSIPVGLLLLVPPVIVVAGSLLKKPTIPVMMISSAVAVVIAMTVQDFSFQTCATSMVSGFKMEMFTDPSLNLAGIVQEVPTFSREAVWLP